MSDPHEASVNVPLLKIIFTKYIRPEPLQDLDLPETHVLECLDTIELWIGLDWLWCDYIFMTWGPHVYFQSRHKGKVPKGKGSQRKVAIS